MSRIDPVTLPPGARKSVSGAVLAIVIAIAGLTALDQTLARIENGEMRGSARRSYDSGSRLLGQGRPLEALEPLREAHVIERENPEYARALIGALMRLGKTNEADTLMDELLTRAPNDGPDNLAAARLMLKEGRPQEAEAYYHRAIYGSWQQDSAAHQRTARLELIELLVAENERTQLLGELIFLENDAGDDIALKKQMAHLFLVAGSASRAAAVYRELVERNPQDPGAYAGLGEAELEQGEYRAARSAFLQASYREPAASVAPQLALLTEVTALDPTPRQITSREKYDRSLKILGLAKDGIQALFASRSGSETPGVTELLKEASGEIARKPPRIVTNEMAERELSLAEKIWKARIAIFGVSTSSGEAPLRLIMERLIV